MRRWLLLAFLVLCLCLALSFADGDDESCPNGQCDESDAPKKKKNKYQKPGAKKNK